MRSNSRTSVIIAGAAILSIVALLGVQTWATVESPMGESLEVIPLSRFGVRHFEGGRRIAPGAPRLRPAEMQAVIRKTRLHHQLAGHLPALTSPR